MWQLYSEPYWPKAVDLKSTIERMVHELDTLATSALHSVNYDQHICFDDEAISQQLKLYEKYQQGYRLATKASEGVIDVDTFCQEMTTLDLKHFLIDLVPYIPFQLVTKYNLDV